MYDLKLVYYVFLAGLLVTNFDCKLDNIFTIDMEAKSTTLEKILIN
jgi:hypothetical protein